MHETGEQTAASSRALVGHGSPAILAANSNPVPRSDDHGNRLLPETPVLPSTGYIADPSTEKQTAVQGNAVIKESANSNNVFSFLV